MNVYQKEFHPEFIKELPVDFQKIKNMDLTTVPKQYHCLFTTDWNWGKYSTMDMDLRMLLQELYLEYMTKEVKKSISRKYIEIEKPVVGFVKD